MKNDHEWQCDWLIARPESVFIFLKLNRTIGY